MSASEKRLSNPRGNPCRRQHNGNHLFHCVLFKGLGDEAHPLLGDQILRGRSLVVGEQMLRGRSRLVGEQILRGRSLAVGEQILRGRSRVTESSTGRALVELYR